MPSSVCSCADAGADADADADMIVDCVVILCVFASSEQRDHRVASCHHRFKTIAATIIFSFIPM